MLFARRRASSSNHLLRAVVLWCLAGLLPVLFPNEAAGQDTDAEEDTSAVAEGRFERLDPQRSRLLISSTARPIGAGEFYLAGQQIFLLQVGVGITSGISLEAGALVLPGEHFGEVLVATPKATLWAGQANALLGRAPLTVAADAQVVAQQVTTLYFSGTASVAPFPLRREHGWAFGVLPRLLATYGTPDAALTAAVGMPFSDGDESGVVMAMLGGELRLLEWLKLLTENEAFFGVDYQFTYLNYNVQQQAVRTVTYRERGAVLYLSIGARFLWDHFALELAALAERNVWRYGDTEVVPLLSLTYRM